MHYFSFICRLVRDGRYSSRSSRLAWCFVSILLCSVGIADDLTAEQVLSIKSPVVELRDSRGVAVDKIRQSWVLNLVTVSQRMAQAYRLRMPTLVIVKQSQPNAFVELRKSETLLVVNTDMLRLIGDDEDLMAAVIGHELAHLRKSHWRHGYEGRSIFSVVHLKANSTTDNRMVEPQDSSGLHNKFAASGSAVPSVGFSREQEGEIGALSVRNMTTAGYDPAAVPRFWRMMQANAGTSSDWLSEHPVGADVLHTMQSVAKSLEEIYAANKAVRVSTANDLILFGARISRMPSTTVGLDGVNGVLVSEVMPQSAAAAAGIASGDILLRVDGTPIDGPDDVKVAVADATRGSLVEVKLLRRAVPVWVHVQF
jgi:Zn-dependent protease with chaperone function